ncbi:hypothetical protein AVEN_106724-1 [Araneus ventricosus]|uniref:Uncharacterized protein n=1 Tax=Araneus ventricosus TaxID=182803 RepID=A0A4Y2EZ30_ARAVE|nr:hypothetical protein AVEN_106724-1 [Araneus ventricosus]
MHSKSTMSVDLLHAKSYVGGQTSCRWCGRSCHLTAVQDYEVSPKITLVLLQDGTLIELTFKNWVEITLFSSSFSLCTNAAQLRCTLLCLRRASCSNSSIISAPAHIQPTSMNEGLMMKENEASTVFSRGWSNSTWSSLYPATSMRRTHDEGKCDIYYVVKEVGLIPLGLAYPPRP